MPATVESAIADLKAQFEKAVAPLQKTGDATESVQVQRAATGQWLFLLHTFRFIECRLEPRALWLAKKRIATTEPDLCFVGARFKGESLLVLVETKHSAEPRSEDREFEWAFLPGFAARDDIFSDPIRNVAAKRSWRALHRILTNAAAHSVEDVASQSSDLAVVVRALEQPEAIETLKEDDPFAEARLRGVRERERLLTEEGGTWSADQAARHLHLTRQTVNLRRKQGALLGLDAGRHGFRYPAWQFARTGTVEGLEQALAALKHLDPWMQQVFMLGKNARLRDRRPIDVLRGGDIAAVVRAASAFGEHGAT
jgi:hypothetical protein